MSAKAYGEDDESEITNYEKLRSLGLIREIIAWNSMGNFDDVSAAIMLMIYREALMTIRVGNEKKVKTSADDPFWLRHYKNKGPLSYSGGNLARNNLGGF